MKEYLLFLSCFIFFTVPSACLSQEQDASESPVPGMLRQAYEDAVKNITSEKAEEEKKIVSELESKLQSALKDWIVAAEEEKRAALNTLIVPDWKGLPGPTPELPYTHYLRDFKYSVVNSDINKTESYTSPYRAVVRVIGKLYVEKYHSPSTSYPKEYFYTITTPFTLIFEYTQGAFKFQEKQCSDASIEQGWPEEIEKNNLKNLDK